MRSCEQRSESRADATRSLHSRVTSAPVRIMRHRRVAVRKRATVGSHARHAAGTILSINSGRTARSSLRTSLVKQARKCEALHFHAPSMFYQCFGSFLMRISSALPWLGMATNVISSFLYIRIAQRRHLTTCSQISRLFFACDSYFLFSRSS